MEFENRGFLIGVSTLVFMFIAQIMSLTGISRNYISIVIALGILTLIYAKRDLVINADNHKAKIGSIIGIVVLMIEFFRIGKLLFLAGSLIG